MSPKQSFNLRDVQETLILPLWGRAVESRKSKPLLIDTKALEIINSIDYDFSAMFVRFCLTSGCAGCQQKGDQGWWYG
jgi:O-methyltransferase involved in polyketide biosynthesis